jgi:HEAT repeat protein
MTENSPENLRKFLESDDPAMVRMGLSMAKGSGVPDELLPTILGLYMWDEDKTVRAASKSVFTKYAPAEIQAKVKENWKASYRTNMTPDSKHVYFLDGSLRKLDKFLKVISQFLEAFKSQDDFAIIVLEPLIKALGDKDRGHNAAEALGDIGDKRAVEPLIKALSDGGQEVRESAARALGEIGDKRAVKPLIKALEDEDYSVRAIAAGALGNIGDKRAVEPLIKALKDKDFNVRYKAAKDNLTLGTGKITISEFAKRVKVNAMPSERSEARYRAAEALGNIGDTRAVEPLTKTLEDGDRDVRNTAKEALKKLGHEVE